jgi:hypothetical protein
MTTRNALGLLSSALLVLLAACAAPADDASAETGQAVAADETVVKVVRPYFASRDPKQTGVDSWDVATVSKEGRQYVVITAYRDTKGEGGEIRHAQLFDIVPDGKELAFRGGLTLSVAAQRAIFTELHEALRTPQGGVAPRALGAKSCGAGLVQGASDLFLVAASVVLLVPLSLGWSAMVCVAAPFEDANIPNRCGNPEPVIGAAKIAGSFGRDVVDDVDSCR